ncbi:hypothetical protein ACFFSH_29720 [Streptomyces filamentosus]|uniref:Uncharacterized protein n=1 Tax=Streptomyces filamentosus TaxID=67294 RepID=A0A919EQ43_STRFL|nr:hypothetical protein [Streptomyces filamentosus]GHG12712.1 hypothetical protein GCM10017667_52810 [Streptomyces filamentosus]
MEQSPAVANTLVVQDEMWELVKNLEHATAVSEPACPGPRTADMLMRPRRDLGARLIHIPFSAQRASDPA